MPILDMAGGRGFGLVGVFSEGDFSVGIGACVGLDVLMGCGVVFVRG